MPEHDLKELLDPVIQIAYQAGKEIMEVYDAGFSIENKSDETPVTEADIAAVKVYLINHAADSDQPEAVGLR